MTLLLCCKARAKAPAIPSKSSSSGGEGPLAASSLVTFFSCFPARMLANRFPRSSLTGGREAEGGLLSLDGGGGGPPERPPPCGGAGPPPAMAI